MATKFPYRVECDGCRTFHFEVTTVTAFGRALHYCNACVGKYVKKALA